MGDFSHNNFTGGSLQVTDMNQQAYWQKSKNKVSLDLSSFSQLPSFCSHFWHNNMGLNYTENLFWE